MVVSYRFRAPALCRHVHDDLLRSALLDLTLIIPVSVCHCESYAERYSRSNFKPTKKPPTPLTPLLVILPRRVTKKSPKLFTPPVASLTTSPNLSRDRIMTP